MSIYITGVGVASSLGLGFANFSRAVLDGSQGFQGPWLDEDGSIVADGAYLVDQYDIVQILGKRKGTRILDRTAAFAVGCSAMALNDRPRIKEAYTEDELGIVLGTLNGSISQVVEFLKLTRNQAEPWMVSPEGFPNTVMNFAAGQCSIWHQVKAVNTTVVGGTLAGLLSLRYAKRMIECGHAKAIVCGSVEEYTKFSDTAVQRTYSTGYPDTPVVMGEGGVMFTLEDGAAQDLSACTRYAELCACEVAFLQDGVDPVTQIIDTIYRTLDKAQVNLKDLAVVVESGAQRRGALEASALERLLAGTEVPRYDLYRHTGYCISATSSLQLAALIAHIQGSGRAGLAVCLSAGGNLGVCVLRGGV